MFKQATQAYIFALALKIVIKIIFRIPRIVRKPKILLKILMSKFNFKYAVFPALLVFLFKGGLCGLRRFHGKKAWNPMLAGFVASFVALW